MKSKSKLVLKTLGKFVVIYESELVLKVCTSLRSKVYNRFHMKSKSKLVLKTLGKFVVSLF